MCIGGRGIAPLILNVEHMELIGVERASATLHAGEDLQYRLNKKLGDLQSGSGRLEKLFLLLRAVEHRIIQHIVQ